MLKKYIAIAFLTFIFCDSYSQTWKVAASSSTTGITISYATNRTSRTKDVITTWLKESCTAAGLHAYRESFLSKRQAAGIFIKGWEHYAYTVTKYFFNCKTMQMAICEADYFNEDGSLIKSLKYCQQGIEWTDTVPDSSGESYLLMMCDLIK